MVSTSRQPELSSRSKRPLEEDLMLHGDGEDGSGHGVCDGRAGQSSAEGEIESWLQGLQRLVIPEYRKPEVLARVKAGTCKSLFSYRQANRSGMLSPGSQSSNSTITATMTMTPIRRQTTPLLYATRRCGNRATACNICHRASVGQCRQIRRHLHIWRLGPHGALIHCLKVAMKSRL